MPSGWDHDKVILALVHRGEKVSNLENTDVYVQCWQQKPNCAVIFTSSSPLHKGKWELEIRESAKSFDPNKIDLHVEYLEKINNWKDWDRYKVKDWNKLAEKLGLSFGEKNEE